MWLTLLALAAASPDEAQLHLSRLARYPEAVEFRNVRTVGDLVCGEINKPWDGAMSGFQPFAYQSRQQWIAGNPNGLGGALNGSYESSELYQARVARADRRGDDVGVKVLRERQKKFETAARAVLAACT